MSAEDKPAVQEYPKLVGDKIVYSRDEEDSHRAKDKPHSEPAKPASGQNLAADAQAKAAGGPLPFSKK